MSKLCKNPTKVILVCLIRRIYNFSDISNVKNDAIRMSWECFIGLTKLTKESCCYCYPVTKEKQNGK